MRTPAGLAGALLVLTAVVAPAAPPLLVDVTASSGLSFRHHAAASERWLLPETMGAGLALLDLEGDGDLDILFLDTGSVPGSPRSVAPASSLWRNVSNPGSGNSLKALRFEPAPPPPLDGLAAMGACTGDVDGDGDSDVYVTGLPGGRLLISEAGRLIRATQGAMPEDPGWGTSCAFFDHDADGNLDLFVAHYVRWSAAAEPACGGEKQGFRSYCPPDRFPPEQDRLFAGDGKGRFRDVTKAAGLEGERGKGLGVVAADLDGNGWTDLYVANDQTPSSLWLNESGRFRDVGMISGTALSEEGKAQAGMGVDAADADGDGDLDLTKTNLDLETNNLYLALATSAATAGATTGATPRYRDAVRASGMAEPSLPMLGFGTLFADLDADGDEDIFVVNGHILPNIAEIRPDQVHAMRDQLYENTALPGAAPRFIDARARWSPASEQAGVGRGLAAGDLDDDGDLDLVMTRCDGAARLLRNEANPQRWLGVRLQAAASAPGAPGARVTFSTAEGSWLRSRRGGGSYLSASDERLLLGLGRAPKGPVHAIVTWPSRRRERFGPLAEGRYQTLTEGSGTALAP